MFLYLFFRNSHSFLIVWHYYLKKCPTSLSWNDEIGCCNSIKRLFISPWMFSARFCGNVYSCYMRDVDVWIFGFPRAPRGYNLCRHHVTHCPVRYVGLQSHVVIHYARGGQILPEEQSWLFVPLRLFRPPLLRVWQLRNRACQDLWIFVQYSFSLTCHFSTQAHVV